MKVPAVLKRPKTYLYAAGAAGTLALGAWAAKWIRRWWGARRLALGSYNTDAGRMIIAAKSQINKAQAGKRLTDYRTAENLSLFWTAPGTDTEAFAKGAYWMAVASRLSGEASLASKASVYAGKATRNFSIPGDNYLFTSNVASILQGAADALTPYAANRQVKAILAAVFSQKDGIANRQAALREQDPVQATSEALTKSGGDAAELVGDASLWIRDAIGLKRPDGTEPPWWRKWIPRAIVGGVVLVGARFALGGHYARAKAAVGTVVTKAREAHSEILGG